MKNRISKMATFILLGIIVSHSGRVFSMKKKGVRIVETKKIPYNSRTLDCIQPVTIWSGFEYAFEGESKICGLNHTLVLNNNAKITVAKDSTLYLRDLTIKINPGSTICLLDDSSKLLLENVTWELESDYHFTKGSFEVVHGTFHIVHKPGSLLDHINLNLLLPKVKFFYQSNKRSTIKNRSTLKFSSMCFAYDPKNRRSDLLSLEGESSILWLKNSTFTHLADIVLKDGKIKLSQNVILDRASASSRMAWNDVSVFADKDDGCKLFVITNLETNRSHININDDGYLLEFKGDGDKKDYK